MLVIDFEPGGSINLIIYCEYKKNTIFGILSNSNSKIF